MRKTYDEIVNIFISKNCELYTTKNEYIAMKEPSKCKFSFKASCSHDNTVTLTNFLQKDSGITCKNCMKKQVSDKLIAFNKNNDQASTKCIIQENLVFNKFNDLLKIDFDVTKTNEGCSADFIIKPKNIIDNKWLGIQLKTTKGICNDLYSFNLHKNQYENMVMLCYSFENNMIWCIPHNIVSHLKRMLNIGLSDKSIYNKYKTNDSTLIIKLNEYFQSFILNTIENYMIPKNIHQQRENIYIKIREQFCNFLEFEKPKVDQSYYDFKINGKNIQEKVATKRNDRKDTYIACMYRSKNSTIKKQQYLLNMNDYYWLHIPDTDLFYIIPEGDLYDNGFIQNPNNDSNTKFNLTIKIYFKNSWYHKYQYNYKNLDKNVIVKLFE